MANDLQGPVNPHGADGAAVRSHEMNRVIEPELVVSTWPFRTGVVVYDPATRNDVVEWDIADAAADPAVMRRYGALLNPMNAYRPRAEAILAALAGTQEALRLGIGLDPEDDSVEVRPVLSDDVERELGTFTAAHGLRVADLSLSRLHRLLATLEERSEEDHHDFVASWQETFSAQTQRPTFVRAIAGPGGGLYTAVHADPAEAEAAWLSDASAGLESFSLWTALRAHWAWRLEFSDQAAPSFPVFADLARLFPGD